MSLDERASLSEDEHSQSVAAAATATAAAGIDFGVIPGQRNSLKGVESIVFDLVFEATTGDEWARWLKLPMEMAAAKGNDALVAMLMRAGAPVGLALRKYLERGGREMVEKILEERPGASEDFVIGEGEGDSPIHFAAGSGSQDIVRSLLQRGAEKDFRGNYGRTPLHLAAQRGHLGAVQALLEAGASVHLRDADGETVLCVAARYGHVEVVRALIEHGADVNVLERPAMGITVLHTVARGDDALLPVVEALLEAGVDTNLSTVTGITPLHMAVHRGSLEVARALLRSGAQVNARNAEGRAPLHYATDVAGREGSAECLELLLR